MMAFALGLLLCAAVGRGDTIKIFVDRMVDPNNGDGKPYQLAPLEVSDQITAADLIEKANFFGKVYYDDWDWQKNYGRTTWGDDGGWFLRNAYGYTEQGPNEKMFISAFYGGVMMRPTSTLRSNGVKPFSTVLLGREIDTKTFFSVSNYRAYVKASFNGKNDYMYFYRREDMWNVFNVLSHRYGIKVDDVKFNVPTKGDISPKRANPTAVPFTTMGKIKDDSGQNPITVTITQSKKCTCMGSGAFASEKGKMTKRLAAANYGLGCGAHDASTKTCSKKHIGKGNRKCWCPRKWCYVEAGCGSPSAKFPGLSFSYDICQNKDNVDCFASDTEGVEAAQLDDFDIWTFPKVTGYLRQMATVLADSFPALKDKFGQD